VKLGLTLPYTDHVPRALMVQFVQEADRLGYDAVWMPEAYGWDAFTGLTQLACATERIGLGTGIVNVFSRSPALIAQTAGSLDEISGGRFRLGLGTSGHQVIEGWHGVRYRKALTRMRETAQIVRTILRRERVQFDGDVFRLDGGLKIITHPVRDSVPIYLATLTPGGIELAGEIADGWMPVFFSPGHHRDAFLPLLEKGAAKAERPVSAVSVCPMVTVVVTDDVAAGRDVVRPHIALYVGGMGSREKNYYNAVFRGYGFEDEACTIQDLFLDRRRAEAIAGVTDEMVDLVTVIGPAPECRRRLEELGSAGVDEVAIGLRVPGDDPAATVAALRELAP
jgi:F420-dependent oxidoreductase-like protein